MVKDCKQTSNGCQNWWSSKWTGGFYWKSNGNVRCWCGCCIQTESKWLNWMAFIVIIAGGYDCEIVSKSISHIKPRWVLSVQRMCMENLIHLKLIHHNQLLNIYVRLHSFTCPNRKRTHTHFKSVSQIVVIRCENSLEQRAAFTNMIYWKWMVNIHLFRWMTESDVNCVFIHFR